jgi:hypothetical protein
MRARGPATVHRVEDGKALSQRRVGHVGFTFELRLGALLWEIADSESQKTDQKTLSSSPYVTAPGRTF